MLASPNPILADWESFYVIIGSSAAGLIGLQFVVITLIADTRARSTPSAIGAFSTPTIIHLGSALFISAILSAPWPSLTGAAIALAACGVAGVAYSALVIYRARRQTSYTPVLEDWLWHVVLPCGAYTSLALAATFLPTSTHGAFFVVAGTALGLLFIAIHNAWDTVTYLVVTNLQTSPHNDQPSDD